MWELWWIISSWINFWCFISLTQVARGATLRGGGALAPGRLRPVVGYAASAVASKSDKGQQSRN